MAREHLLAGLATGVSTVCRCWRLVRRDGGTLGFTDHDRDLSFEGVVFQAETGISARALLQTTGLAVDNSEAAGALTAAALTEAEIAEGRYDGAEITAWLVDWADPAARMVEFRGSLGELSRGEGAFTAELRGLSAPLNESQGRAFLGRCSAVLGDGRCRVDLGAAAFSAEVAVAAMRGDTVIEVASGALGGFAARWFERGRVSVVSGAAAGLWAAVKSDRVLAGGARRLELWAGLRAVPAAGDLIRVAAGCDKAGATCRDKFGNFVNFRGFPTIPGDDWLTVSPVRSRR